MSSTPARRSRSDRTDRTEEMREFAREAGLSYVSDERPGIRRTRRGKAFRYTHADGSVVRDKTSLARIRSLAVPPAYENVWISPDASGHIQATGVDARGRKQYRYHPRWREVRDSNKFAHVMEFGRALPAIRRRATRDMRRPGLAREKVLATVLRLLEKSLIRVGNEEYARTNRSFGLSTLQNRHARVRGAHIRFHFRGKSGVFHDIDVEDPRLARVVKRCQDLPGQDLFQYLDDAGKPHPVSSNDVNAYLREISGRDFTAKDFRTWAGTVLASIALAELGPCAQSREGKRRITHAVQAVAKRLGNTPAICRKCYVHPAIFNSYLDGATIRVVAGRAEALLRAGTAPHTEVTRAEREVLGFLSRRLKREARADK